MNKLFLLLMSVLFFTSCNMWMNCKCVMRYEVIKNRVMENQYEENIIGLYEVKVKSISKNDTVNYKLSTTSNSNIVQYIYLEIGNYGYTAYTTTNFKNKFIDIFKRQKQYFNKCGKYEIIDLSTKEIEIELESKNSEAKIQLFGYYNFNEIIIDEIAYWPEEEPGNQPKFVKPKDIFMLEDDSLVFVRKVNEREQPFLTYENFLQSIKSKKK